MNENQIQNNTNVPEPVNTENKHTGLKISTIISLILMVADYLIPDLLPFVDEALLTLITGILGSILVYLKTKNK